jgi:hypothetical protein
MMNIRRQKRNDVGASCSWRFLASAGRHRIRQASVFLIACGLFFNAAPEILSQNDERMEYPVKLAFLYNFTKFIEWPPDSYRDAGTPLRICVAGKDPFSDDLERELQTRTVGGRRLEIKSLKSSDTLQGCHLVFVPAMEVKLAAGIVARLNGSSALTVGESAGFTGLGGMINFTVEDNNVHFEVNVDAAERARLQISSKLLILARIIKEQGHGGKS